MNSYELSRAWFDYCYENPEKISPNHSAIYFFAIDHCNRLGWKTKFGFPTQMAMDAIGIKKHQTYIRYFNELVEWEFFELVQRSQNQYSANIITIKSGVLKNGKALDKAIINHAAKQTEAIWQSNGQSNSSINKPNNYIKPIIIKELNIPEFSEFLIFAKEKEPSINEQSLKLKYESWVVNDWKDGNDNKIKNWKMKLCNTLPYLLKNTNSSNSGKPFTQSPIL